MGGAHARIAVIGESVLRPLQLTDAQLDAIMCATAPLAPDARGPFLEAIAAALRGRLPSAILVGMYPGCTPRRSRVHVIAIVLDFVGRSAEI
jgi:hypothetical protein